MLRYYPPLPYYLLWLISQITQNPVSAANWLIAFSAFFGGVTWLLYTRWIGWVPAIAGGALYLFLPDNIRVALAEGNLPRTLASALLPLALYFLLQILDKNHRRRYMILLGLCFTLILLSHAMMAAIYAACFTLLTLLAWLWRSIAFRQVLETISALALGIMLGGWWFLPSLAGGITELDSSAMTEALSVIPLTNYLAPTMRITNPEAVYPGAVLFIISLISMFVASGRDGKTLALGITGFFGILISTPGFNALFNALPMHNLFWPLRFLGIASTLLLLALVWRFQAIQKNKRWLMLIILIPLLVDQWISTRLIFLRPANPDIIASARQVSGNSGWRQATLDFSKLGSAASYYYTALGSREQLFGWAYQGARTARNVANLNEAVSTHSYTYLLNRITLYGADDLIFLNEELHQPLLDLLSNAGYQAQYQGKTLTHFHQDGVPRAYLANWHILGIGKGAYNLSFVFPEIIVGGRTKVDQYTLEDLTAYHTLFLSGFEWDNRDRAEQLIQQAAQAGVTVVVDMTGIPDEPLAREPHFLGVWGEPITLPDTPIVLNDGKGKLAPVGDNFPDWVTHTPQGLQVETITSKYLNVSNTILGYNQYGEGKVWFVGLNLPYRVFLNRDPWIINMFSQLLDVQSAGSLSYQSVPLGQYLATESGYTFTYRLDQPHELIVPVAYHDGTIVKVDGQPVKNASIENLVMFAAPVGEHQVEIEVRPTPIYFLGQVTSLAALAGFLVAGFWHRKVRPL